MNIPGERALLDLAAGLGWPGVRVGTLDVSGESAWRRVLGGSPRPVPAERMALYEGLLAAAGLAKLGTPDWLHPELVGSEAARARLLAWADAGSPAVSGDRIVRSTRFVGDVEILHPLQQALHERIPAPVVDYLLTGVLFLGVGASTQGWTCRVAMPPGDALSIIQICGASGDHAHILDITLHEAAHRWLLRDYDTLPAERLYIVQGATLIRAAADPALMADVLQQQALDEGQADALARIWGGRLSCSDSRACAYTKAHAAQLAAAYGPGCRGR